MLDYQNIYAVKKINAISSCRFRLIAARLSSGFYRVIIKSIKSKIDQSIIATVNIQS